MRGQLTAVLFTIIMFIVGVIAIVIGVGFLIVSENAQDITGFRFVTSIEGSGLSGGVLEYSVEGDSVARIATLSVPRGTLASADANASAVSLYLARLAGLLDARYKLRVSFESAGFEANNAPEYCGTGELIAYCENQQKGCSSGRIKCIGGECSRCTNGNVCCKELYNVNTERYDDEPDYVLCEERRGICEAVSCSSGREKIRREDSCAAALSKEPAMKPVPVYGLEEPFVCCRPMREDELRKIVRRSDAPSLEVPLFLPGDQISPVGYTGNIIITAETT